MHTRTSEWVAKAESDYRVAVLAAQAMNPTEPDAVCFHAQQCVEKYAKGFLTEHDIEFPRTHNLEYLHEQCTKADPDFAPYSQDFKNLDEYSVDIRYPGDDASEREAQDALEILNRLRPFLRQKLNLPLT